MIDMQDREAVMVAQYGEVCTQTTAARVLSCSTATVRVMLDDGRLDRACGGRMVDVRSIARYIAAPAQEDFEARRRKLMRRNGTSFAV